MPGVVGMNEGDGSGKAELTNRNARAPCHSWKRAESAPTVSTTRH